MNHPQKTASLRSTLLVSARTRTIALLMLVVAVGHFNRVGISVAGAESIIPHHGVSVVRMGMVYSAFLVFYTLAMLPGGWFGDRFGPRAALVFLGFASSVFVALTGAVGLAAHDVVALWLGLMVVRSCLGATNAPLHPSAARIVYENAAPDSTVLVNGLVCFAACAGIASTYYVMGALIDQFGWPVAFLISGALTLAVAGIWTAATRSGHVSTAKAAARDPVAPDFWSLWRIMRQRSVICITLSYTALGYFQYLFFYWIEYYFETIQMQSRSVARDYSTTITLAMGAGMIIGGWLSDHSPRSLSPRARRALVPMLGMLAAGGVFELGLMAASPRTTLVAFAFAAAFIGACEGAFWTTAVELGGQYGGTAAGLMNTGGNAGGALSPYLTPLLSTYFTARYGPDLGWRLGLAVAGIVSVAGAGLWFGITPPSKILNLTSDADRPPPDLS